MVLVFCFGSFFLPCGRFFFSSLMTFCCLPVGREEVAFWGARDVWVMLMSPAAGDVIHSPAAACSSFAGQPKLALRKKISFRKKKKGFFSIAFYQHNYTGWGCGCILNFLLIFFSSFYQLLAHLKYGSNQGKCEMPWFLVCRKELICL